MPFTESNLAAIRPGVRIRRLCRVAGVLTAAVLSATACGGGVGGGASDDGTGPIIVSSILDLTGPLNIYGVPKQQATEMAVAEINEAGGVLGRQLELRSYDAQSAQEKYTQFANQVALQDRPAVVMAGITSAAREAIRPTFDRNDILYFYNQHYEGGACGKNLFVAGAVPSAQLSDLIPDAVAEFGPRVYIVAADYNFGQISAQWAQRYVQESGGEVLQIDFVPLESSNFDSVINDIQRLKPDFVFSALVGGNHIGFYRNFAAAGLNRDTKIVSSTFGLGNEQILLSPAEAQGIRVAYPYFQELANPENHKFTADWVGRYGPDASITDSAVSSYIGWKIWAAAAEQAGSIERDRVIEALESGLSIDSPMGQVAVDPKSHHLVEPMSTAEVNASHGFDVIATEEAVNPTFEQEKCDLIGDPDLNTSFVP